jgi:RimJ/RimL family protein N-acetyltransferase
MRTEAEARPHLDRFFAHALDYQPGLLEKTPGVSYLAMSSSAAPFSLFRKCALILHAPRSPEGTRSSCLLAVHPLLLDEMLPLLRSMTVERIFADETADQLSRLVRAAFPASTLLPEGERLVVRFVTSETFRRFESEAFGRPIALDGHHLEHLPLLTRYPGGVYAFCDEQGQILSRAGIRAESALVWEIGVRTEREHLRGRGLAKAVVSAATEAVLATGRVPLYIHSATNLASQKVALALGYQHYADERLWTLLE